MELYNKILKEDERYIPMNTPHADTILYTKYWPMNQWKRQAKETVNKKKFSPVAYQPQINNYCTMFLDEKMNKNQNMLEIGIGIGTIWFLERLGHVTSIEYKNKGQIWYKDNNGKEDNSDFLNYLKKDIDQRDLMNKYTSHYIETSLAADANDGTNNVKKYGNSMEDLFKKMKINNEKFNYILIDGHWCRDWSCEAIIKYDLLEKNGLIILDDYDSLVDTRVAVTYLKKNGFSALEFKKDSLGHETAIFYVKTQ